MQESISFASFDKYMRRSIVQSMQRSLLPLVGMTAGAITQRPRKRAFWAFQGLRKPFGAKLGHGWLLGCTCSRLCMAAIVSMHVLCV